MYYTWGKTVSDFQLSNGEYRERNMPAHGTEIGARNIRNIYDLVSIVIQRSTNMTVDIMEIDK